MTDFRIGKGDERRWGPDGRWGLWIGSGVLEGLIDLLDQFLSTPPEISARWDPYPAALGCVPWLTHPGIVERLARVAACVVIDKPDRASWMLQGFAERGSPFPRQALPGFEHYAPRGDDGKPRIVGPYAPSPSDEESGIGPVRVAGFREDRRAPLLHTKLLVLGHVAWVEDEFSCESQHYFPKVAWWGSANWSRGAERHIEMGTSSDDPQMLQQAIRFISDLLKISEPLDSTSVFPEPEFAEVEFDDASFFEYLAEHDEPPPDEQGAQGDDAPQAYL